MTSGRLLFLAFLAVLIFSVVPVLISATAANEMLVAISRAGIAALTLTPFIFFARGLFNLGYKDWLKLVVIGAVFAAHWLSYFVSIKWSSASLAATMVATFSVHYLILAWWINNEKLRPLEFVCILVCFSGCVVIAPEISLSSDVSLGLLIGCVSAILYALLPILHQRAKAISSLDRAWAQFFFAFVFLIPFLPKANLEVVPDEWGKLLILALPCTVIAHGLWVKVTTELPAVFTGLIYYLYAPLTSVISLFVFGETIDRNKVIGTLMIIGAGVAVTLLRWYETWVSRQVLLN